MTVSSDPLTRVEAGIWAMLELHEPLTTLVRINNRVKLVDPDNDEPFAKTQVSTADLPELVLIPNGLVFTDQTGRPATSSNFFITQTYDLSIYTGKWRTGAVGGINQLQWEVAMAMLRLVSRSPQPMPGQYECRYTFPESAQQQIATRGGTVDQQGRATGGIQGWYSLMKIRATLVIPRNLWGAQP